MGSNPVKLCFSSKKTFVGKQNYNMKKKQFFESDFRKVFINKKFNDFLELKRKKSYSGKTNQKGKWWPKNSKKMKNFL